MRGNRFLMEEAGIFGMKSERGHLNARKRPTIVRHDVQKSSLFDTEEGLMFAVEVPNGSEIASTGYIPKDNGSKYFSTLFIEEMPQTDEEHTKTLFLCFVRDGMPQPAQHPLKEEDTNLWIYEHTLPAKDFSGRVAIYHLYRFQTSQYEDDLPF